MDGRSVREEILAVVDDDERPLSEEGLLGGEALRRCADGIREFAAICHLERARRVGTVLSFGWRGENRQLRIAVGERARRGDAEVAGRVHVAVDLVRIAEGKLPAEILARLDGYRVEPFKGVPVAAMLLVGWDAGRLPLEVNTHVGGCRRTDARPTSLQACLVRVACRRLDRGEASGDEDLLTGTQSSEAAQQGGAARRAAVDASQQHVVGVSAEPGGANRAALGSRIEEELRDVAAVFVLRPHVEPGHIARRDRTGCRSRIALAFVARSS